VATHGSTLNAEKELWDNTFAGSILNHHRAAATKPTPASGQTTNDLTSQHTILIL
jgi:hypothetical protein